MTKGETRVSVLSICRHSLVLSLGTRDGTHGRQEGSRLGSRCCLAIPPKNTLNQ